MMGILDKFVALKMPPFVARHWKGGEVRADFPPFFFTLTFLLKQFLSLNVFLLVFPHNVETERKNEATKMSSSYMTLAYGTVLVFVQNELNQTTLLARNSRSKWRGR